MNEDSKVRGLDSLIARMNAARVVILFLFHVAAFAGCYLFACLLRFEFAVPAEYMPLLRSSFPVVVGVQLIAGVFFGFYRGWWRYVGIADVSRLVAGLTAATAVLIGAWYASQVFGNQQHAVMAPRGVLLIDWAFALLFLFGARVVIRLGRDHLRPAEMSREKKRVLIIGAGDAGETLAREIEHRPQLGMKVVGFVDDQRTKWNSQIRGIRVSGPLEKIASLADELHADEALIAIPSATGKRLREIIQHLATADLKFKTIPGIDHLVTGRVHVTQLRPVNVEDLLRRERINLPGDPVRELFRGKRIVITGAGGTIGSELASQIAQLEPECLALVERSEYALYEVNKRLSREAAWMAPRISCNLVDIRDEINVKQLFARERPEIVLHAAAHKHVPLGEQNPPEYLRNNCLATARLAEICVERGVGRFVFISTDKAINPSSVMGATKRAAEIALLDLSKEGPMKTTIVRFGNVIGSSGSVIPLFMEQIAAGGPVTVTHPDMTRYFLRTSEAVSLVLQAAVLGDAGHIFMLDMGEPVKIADLARDLIQLSNHNTDEIPIVFSGVRPGEKLFEELRMEGESIRPTLHPQIVITESLQPGSEEIRAWLRRAQRATTAAEAIRALSDLEPEYVSVLDGAAEPPPLVHFPAPHIRSQRDS